RSCRPTQGDIALTVGALTSRGAASPRPVRRPRHPLLLAAAALVCAAMLLPVATLGFLAISGSGEDWPHLARYVVPSAARNTILLILLTSVGTAAVGVAAAWAAVAYDFPFRRTLSWMLVLPLAVPPYLAAYAFGEFFLFTGPVQTAWRALFGFQSA